MSEMNTAIICIGRTKPSLRAGGIGAQQSLRLAYPIQRMPLDAGRAGLRALDNALARRFSRAPMAGTAAGYHIEATEYESWGRRA